MDGLSAHERRISVRLLAYWEKLRAGRPMPLATEVNPEPIRDLWPYCFLLAIRPAAPGFEVLHMGEAIRAATRAADGCSPNAEWLAISCAQIVKTGRPVVDEGEFRGAQGGLVRYRQCLLPLAGQEGVGAVLGGMRCKRYGGSERAAQPDEGDGNVAPK